MENEFKHKNCIDCGTWEGNKQANEFKSLSEKMTLFSIGSKGSLLELFKPEDIKEAVKRLKGLTLGTTFERQRVVEAQIDEIFGDKLNGK